MNRCRMIVVLALSLAVVMAEWSAAGQDELRRLVEALAMDIPMRVDAAGTVRTVELDHRW